MSEHTPGPWTAGLNSDLRLIWAGSICIGSALSSGISKKQQIANAKLWAAAPDLLAACQRLLDLHDSCLGVFDEQYNPEGGAIIADMRAAMAKATGGEPQLPSVWNQLTAEQQEEWRQRYK